jgi:hypothetical protein
MLRWAGCEDVNHSANGSGAYRWGEIFPPKTTFHVSCILRSRHSTTLLSQCANEQLAAGRSCRNKFTVVPFLGGEIVKRGCWVGRNF